MTWANISPQKLKFNYKFYSFRDFFLVKNSKGENKKYNDIETTKYLFQRLN